MKHETTGRLIQKLQKELPILSRNHDSVKMEMGLGCPEVFLLSQLVIILAVKVEQFLEGEEHRLKLRSATALNLKSLEVHSMGMAHGIHKKIKDGQLYVKLPYRFAVADQGYSG